MQLFFRSDAQCLGLAQSFVAGVQARDGGDAPEDVHGALHKAMQMDWGVGGSQTRVLVHIADAPCHGTKYHTYGAGVDKYPGGDPHGLQSEELLRGLRQLGVCYSFGRINSSTDRMVELFDQEAGGGYISSCEVADCRAITKAVTAELRKSIGCTFDLLLHGHAIKGKRPCDSILLPCISEDESEAAAAAAVPGGKKAYVIREGLPDWGLVAALPVTLFSNKPIENIEQLTKDRKKMVLWILPWGKAEPTDGTEKKDMEVKIAPDPFAEGHCRLAYHGLLRGKSVVLKVFILHSAQTPTDSIAPASHSEHLIRPTSALAHHPPRPSQAPPSPKLCALRVLLIVSTSWKCTPPCSSRPNRKMQTS